MRTTARAPGQASTRFGIRGGYVTRGGNDVSMAPIRRYLRISKYSVLECRIYLENPADSRWLLNPREPVLPRVFESIRPLVLPKLREESQRALAKKKSNPVKDVLAEGGLLLNPPSFLSSSFLTFFAFDR